MGWSQNSPTAGNVAEIGKFRTMVALKKTEERLSRNPNREGLTGTVQNKVPRQAAERIDKDTLPTIAPATSARHSARKAKVSISSS
jgi:hypothetical protein